MAYQPRLLKDGASTREDDEVGDAAHLIAGRKFWVSFCVYFQDDGLTCHVCGCAGDLRSCGPAWATPASPEVHQNRYGGVLDDVVKQGGVDGKGLSDGREFGLARSAAASGAKMPGRDAVFLLAVTAGANDGHG